METTRTRNVAPEKRNKAREFAVAAAVGLAILGTSVSIMAQSEPPAQDSAPVKKIKIHPVGSAAPQGSASAVAAPAPAPTVTAAPTKDGGVPDRKISVDDDQKPAPAPAPVAKPQAPSSQVDTPAVPMTPAAFSALTEGVNTLIKSMLFMPDPNDQRYRFSLVRPVLAFGGQTYNRTVAPGITARLNQRGIAAFDSNASLTLGSSSIIPDSYSYLRGGVEAYSLVANGNGSYSNGNASLTWPLTDGKNIFNPNGWTLGPYLEVHNMWIVGPSTDYPTVTGWDLSLNVSALHSSMDMAVQYNQAGALVSNAVHDGGWSFPIGVELTHPHLGGDIPLPRFEALGATYTPGAEIFSVYAAGSLNFSKEWRLVAIPRVTDTFGAVGLGGDLKVDYKPDGAKWLRLGAGPIYSHTFGLDTNMVGGFGELGLGYPALPVNLSVRAGGVTELGGDSFSRTPTSGFLWLNISK